MLPEKVQRWAGLIPVVFLGLFLGRLASERARPGLVGAVAITLVITLIAIIILFRQPVRLTWPLGLLALYVLAPEPAPKTALLIGFLTVVTFLLNLPRQSFAAGVGRFGVKDWQVRGGVLVLLTAGFFVLYVGTLSPDILPADNGEFQLAAAELGVAHPPGFALYTMLAAVMARLPLGGSPAFRVNLLSAVTSTATLVLVYLSVYRLVRSKVAAITAVLALGTATTFWVQATTANIRSLTALFAAAAIYALVVLWTQVSSEGKQLSKRSLIPFILILSLGLTHHASLVFMGLVFALFVGLVDRKLLTTVRFWPGYILAGLAGLLPLLYLVWRGAAGALGAPDDLTTVSGFLNHVLALGFRGDFFYFTEPTLLWERLRVMGNVLTFQFHPILLIGMIVGLAVMIMRSWKLAVLIGGSFLVHTLVTATYRAPQTVEYMIPAYVPLVIALGYGIGTVKVSFRPLAAAVLLTAVLGQTLSHLPDFRWLHVAEDTRDYVEPLLEQAPE
ncbi:MAG: DUF2723 domain-containing protein, partial [Candidatus Promineifilaceae bacterium]